MSVGIFGGSYGDKGESLLPCPFCGGEAHFFHYSAYSIDSSFDAVGCKDCKAMIEDGTAEEWNQRKPA